MVIDHIDNGENEEQPNNEGDKPSGFSVEIVEHALDHIRDVIKGNGVSSQHVTLEKAEGTVLKFEAYNFFPIDANSSDKRVSGREKGQVCGSTGDVKTRIQAEIETLANNKDIKKTTIQQLKTRNDLGFAAPDLVIRLDKYRQRYVVHESCHICRGDGKIECKHCRAKGWEVCNRCHGDRFMQCNMCRGTGTSNTPEGGQQQCVTCRGEGRIPCRYCNQTGRQQCTMCKGKGQLACHECNNTGWQSHVTTVQFKTNGKFSYQKDRLPQDVIPIIDGLGPALITEKHAEAVIVEDTARNDEFDKKSDNDEFVVGYDTSLPWGELEVKLKSMPVRCKVLGYNGELLQVTPFMEKVTAKPLSLLNQAAGNSDLIEGNLKQAGKYRIIREIVYAASRFPLNKGLSYLETKYPFGYQDGTLKSALTKTDQILKNITRSPRKRGFIFGLVASSLIFSGYLFGQIGKIIEPALPLQSNGIVPDIMAFAVSAAAGIYTIKITAKKALHSVISNLLPAKSQGTLMPKAGNLGLYIVGANIVIFLILTELARQSGMEASDWYNNLLGITPPPTTP